MDWNPIVQLLDELRDGKRSLLDMISATSRYDRASLAESLLYLADRELVGLAAGEYPFEPIPRTEWSRRMRDAFASGSSDPLGLAGLSVGLTERGEKVLELFGIGYP